MDLDIVFAGSRTQIEKAFLNLSTLCSQYALRTDIKDKKKTPIPATFTIIDYDETTDLFTGLLAKVLGDLLLTQDCLTILVTQTDTRGFGEDGPRYSNDERTGVTTDNRPWE